MVRIHLWAPLSTQLTQWASIIEEKTKKFQETYLTQVKRSYAHLRITSLTKHNVDQLIARKNEKGEINILIINQFDLDGPDTLESILSPLIEAFNGTILSQLLIFDLIKLGKDSRPTTQRLKQFLYHNNRENELVIIGDFSNHKCFYRHEEICLKCLIKVNLFLSHALIQTQFRRVTTSRHVFQKLIQSRFREQ